MPPPGPDQGIAELVQAVLGDSDYSLLRHDPHLGVVVRIPAGLEPNCAVHEADVADSMGQQHAGIFRIRERHDVTGSSVQRRDLSIDHHVSRVDRGFHASGHDGQHHQIAEEDRDEEGGTDDRRETQRGPRHEPPDQLDDGSDPSQAFLASHTNEAVADCPWLVALPSKTISYR